jgi:cysteine synthase
MAYENFCDMVGRTPCVRYQTSELKHARIFVKLEGQNPTGSVKDRAGLYNILGAKQDGSLAPRQTILDASSGNMACSLVYFGAILGYPVEVVCSSKLTSDKAAFIKYFGGKLQQVGDFTIDGARHCRDVLVTREPGKYAFLDQLHNWNNPEAHFKTTGPEIAEEFPAIAMAVGSLGSGGTLNGVARFLKKFNPAIKIVSVESAHGTKIPGVGTFVDGDYVTPFIQQLDSEKLIDQRTAITLDAAMRRIRDMREQGFFCGPQTAAVVEAAVNSAISNNIAGDIVVISGDAGWKNMDKLGASC